MSDATVLAVGIPVDEENEEFEEKYETEIDNSLENAIRLDKLFWICAGYQDKERGTPDGVIGVTIFWTWNSAIELDDKVFAKIEKAKQFIKAKTGKEAKIFVIGEQT